MRLPVDNLALKGASLALAGLLWYVIAGEKTSEMGITVPVQLQNFPRDLELTGEPVNAVEVRLRASPGVMQGLAPGDVSARLDLAGVGEGEHIIHLTPESVRVPFGVHVVRINPSTLILNFERTVQKSVPVRARLIGRPASGYEVADVITEPAQVRVAGPKGRVQEVESAFTEPLSVEAAQAVVRDLVNVGLEDPLLRVVGSPRVTVTAQVRQILQTRVVGDVEVAARGGSAELRPARVAVTLQGPPDALKRVRRADVRAYADLGQGKAGGTAPVTVELAGGHRDVTIKEWAPTSVSVRTRRRGSR